MLTVAFCQSYKKSSPSKQETDEKFGRLWFTSLARFHRVNNPLNWDFDETHVIEFLRYKIKEKMPTWKRLKIVQGLIWYRTNVRKSQIPKLEDIRSKLRDMAAKEREREAQIGTSENTIEGVVGKINPRESDVIQWLRRTMRVNGLRFNSEKAKGDGGNICIDCDHSDGFFVATQYFNILWKTASSEGRSQLAMIIRA